MELRQAIKSERPELLNVYHPLPCGEHGQCFLGLLLMLDDQTWVIFKASKIQGSKGVVLLNLAAHFFTVDKAGTSFPNVATISA